MAAQAETWMTSSPLLPKPRWLVDAHVGGRIPEAGSIAGRFLWDLTWRRGWTKSFGIEPRSARPTSLHENAVTASAAGPRRRGVGMEWRRPSDAKSTLPINPLIDCRTPPVCQPWCTNRWVRCRPSAALVSDAYRKNATCVGTLTFKQNRAACFENRRPRRLRESAKLGRPLSRAEAIDG